MDKPISYLLVDDDDDERAPEPTLVAQPEPKGSGTGKTHDGTIDRPMTRAPSEPLFFPQSDDEDASGNVDGGAKRKHVPSERNNEPVQASRMATTATPSTSTSAATLTGITRSSTHVVPEKPRSVQTVLSTRGATWNLRKDDNEEAGRERKQARMSSDGDRVRATRKTFRSSLSQFLSTSGGSKAVPDGREWGRERE